MKECKKCGTEHEKLGAFCSRKCANSRIQTKDQNLARSEKLKGQRTGPREDRRIPRVENACLGCGKVFLTRPKETKSYCSRKCNPNMGGYREKSGRSKSGYYKGIYSGSTYELAWMIYQIDHGIPFDRFDKKLTYDGTSYIPDFIQDGKIVEIKGYEDAKVKKKIEVARYHGYDVIVLKKDDLSKEFEWVREKYRVKNLYELYDDYSPKYSYRCLFCETEFFRDKKKEGKVFCSRVCSGKRQIKEC